MCLISIYFDRMTKGKSGAKGSEERRTKRTGGGRSTEVAAAAVVVKVVVVNANTFVPC